MEAVTGKTGNKYLDGMGEKCIFAKNIKDMNTITLDLNIPADFNVDLNMLKSAATDYIQKYIYMLQTEKNAKTQNNVSSAIKEIKGCISSDLTYDEMIEEALTNKYKI